MFGSNRVVPACFVILNMMMIVVCADNRSFAQYPTEERAFAVAEIKKIAREYQRRRESSEFETVHYQLEGTWTAPRHGFIPPHETVSRFPANDEVKDYSAEILLDVSTRQYQLASHSFSFYTSSRPAIGNKIRSRNHFNDWDGDRLMVFERDQWERKQSGETSFWQPDITVYSGEKRGSPLEFLPFFFAHGHVLVTNAAKQPTNYFDWLLFDQEDEFEGHDCVVLRDIDGRRKYWFARDLDYSIVKFWTTWGPRDPNTEIVIDYETVDGEPVVKSFRLAMYSGREIASRIIDAEVSQFERGFEFTERKKEYDLETGMYWIDRTELISTDPGRYRSYVIGPNKEKFSVELCWQFQWWIP